MVDFKVGQIVSWIGYEYQAPYVGDSKAFCIPQKVFGTLVEVRSVHRENITIASIGIKPFSGGKVVYLPPSSLTLESDIV